MRFMLRSLVLTSAALCATAAFASDRAVATIPFNFEVHGTAFPAGDYAVSVDMKTNLLTLRGTSSTQRSMTWVASPAESNPREPVLRMKFDDAGNTHVLHSVQLGSRTTSVLDAPAKHHGAGSSVAAVSGQ
jgi:hypothetical protein